MPKIDLEELLKKQAQREAKVDQQRARLNVRVRKARSRLNAQARKVETHRNIGQGQLTEEVDLLPLARDRRWLRLSAETRQALVLYFQAGIQDEKTIRAWEKAGRAGQAVNAEPPAEEPPAALPTAAE